MGCSNTPFSGSQMSFLENGGGILQIETSEKMAMSNIEQFICDKYICDSVIAYLFLGKFYLSFVLLCSEMDVSIT